MKKKIHSKGETFDKLTLLKEVDKGKRGPRWLCLCDCGNEIILYIRLLRNGNTKSCGCMRKETLLKRREDLTGQKFNRLFVKEEFIPEIKDENYFRYWLCKCDCGGTAISKGYSLKSGKTKSCGCLLKDLNKGRIVKYSGLHSLYGSYKRHSNENNREFLLTLEEFKELTQLRCYYCNSEPKQISKNNRPNSIPYIYNGVDRIDNTKGYYLDNCVPCCGHCNYAKRSLSLNEFTEWVKTCYENLKLKGLISDGNGK